MIVLTGKRNKLIYSLLHYDFVQYTTVYEYMSTLDFHRDWSYRLHYITDFCPILENLIRIDSLINIRIKGCVGDNIPFFRTVAFRSGYLDLASAKI